MNNDKSQKHIGDGHRGRLREKFLQSGLEGFLDYEIIEMLLTLGTPRKDCKQPAKEAVAKFKGLSNVLDATTSKSPALQIALDNKELFPGTPLDNFMANTKSYVWHYFCALKHRDRLISICTVPKSDGSICASQFKGTFTTNLRGHLRV